ncbi:MAG: EFR1 family ferrodoxin [Candidatus Omnitrophota bacterium]|jgi:ferredoxin/flavodoxin
MENIIFYFSGTGNSLQVARDLARELGRASIISIAKIGGKEFEASPKRLGLVFPVYMFGMPLIVKDFIKRLDVSKETYIFAVATFAGMAGNTLGLVGEELKAKGLRLASGFLVKMPGNYTPLYGAISLRRQEKLFKEESLKVKEIARVVSSGKTKESERSFFILNKVSSIIYSRMSPKIYGFDKGFWADNKCNSCGACQRVCPVKNIKIVDKKPVWLHKCEQCFACLQWCPQESIQYQNKTAFRKRYRNPKVSIGDFYS